LRTLRILNFCGNVRKVGEIEKVGKKCGKLQHLKVNDVAYVSDSENSVFCVNHEYVKKNCGNVREVGKIQKLEKVENFNI